MPKYSVIIPTYNNADRIRRSVKSVLNQKFEDWELIIVDDGSTDETSTVVSAFLKDRRIKYIKIKNSGVSVARHTGVENAIGEYLTFVDGDDEVKENWLTDFNELISGNTGYLSCGYHLNGEDKYPKFNKEISEFKYSSLAGTFALTKIVYDSIGGYDQNLKQSENYEMTARAVEYCFNNDMRVVYTDNCNFIYHHSKTHEQTLERDRLRAQATLYLHEKYSNGGILHFRKDNYLKSAAVNFIRIGEIAKGRSILLKIIKNKPSLSSFLDLLVIEIPFLRKKIWIRKST